MKLLDERGRLFGLINLIDLAVVLIIAALGAGLYFKSNKLVDSTPLSTTPIKMEILCMDMNPDIAGQIKVGDGLWESDTKAFLGKVTNLEVRQARQMIPTADGRMVWADLPNRKEVLLTLQGDGTISEGEVRLGRRDVRAGLLVFVHSQTWTARGAFQRVSW